jgi:hypothetical protein
LVKNFNFFMLNYFFFLFIIVYIIFKDYKQRFYDALKVDIPILTKYNYDKFEMTPNLSSEKLSVYSSYESKDFQILKKFLF